MKKDYLIIDRAKWRTGYFSDNQTGRGDTQLLNAEGYMCCLGFRCLQMGVPENELLDTSTPGDLADKWQIPDLVLKKSKIQNDGPDYNTEFSYKAMDINDDVDLTPEEREKRIIKYFAKKNIIVEFVGKYN